MTNPRKLGKPCLPSLSGRGPAHITGPCRIPKQPLRTSCQTARNHLSFTMDAHYGRYGAAVLMAKGNPNPSPETRFKPGDVNNPRGKTSEHLRAEARAAEISAKLRAAALIRLLEKVDAGEMDAMEAISSDNLRLFKDSEDRAHGTPKQSVEHGGEGGGPVVFRWMKDGD